jgi:hypothetical protein
MNKVWIVKTRTGCSDPDCCGGPSISVRIYSTEAYAKVYAEESCGRIVEEVTIDTDEAVYIC